MRESTLHFNLFVFLILWGCSDLPTSAQDLGASKDQENIEIIGFLPGERCKTDADCASVRCEDGFCTEPSCKDTIRNGLETHTDCGGPLCPRCSDLSPCVVDDDCLSLHCNNQTCSLPECQNTAQDGFESDIDCGGLCTLCSPGQRCRWDSDCAATRCQNQICAPPSCQDLLHNGEELDVDCGPPCGPCHSGQRCLVAPDCVSSASCVQGICVLPQSCQDLLLQGQSQSAPYWLDPGGPFAGSPEILVYCDMHTLGGGWILIGRSLPGGHPPACANDTSPQPFGWFAQSGDVLDNAQAYSLGIGGLDIPFNEVIWGDYRGDKLWGDHVYHHTLPSNFVNRYRSQPVLVGEPTVVQGTCTPSGSMFNWMGITLNTNFFYFRDLADNGWGLYADGFHTCHSDCDRGGLLNGKQGMIMVR